MLVNFYKVAGGSLQPATDIDREKLTKLKNGELYQIEIRTPRNPAFHRKAFAFFHHCFQYWKSDREFIDEPGQFDVFRKQLTVLAGYYHEYYKFDGTVRVEAMSLSYGSMTAEQFDQCYNALVQAAIKHIFTGMDEQHVYQELAGFL